MAPAIAHQDTKVSLVTTRNASNLANMVHVMVKPVPVSATLGMKFRAVHVTAAQQPVQPIVPPTVPVFVANASAKPGGLGIVAAAPPIIVLP